MKGRVFQTANNGFYYLLQNIEGNKGKSYDNDEGKKIFYWKLFS